jgi:hypothetical protein
MVAGAATHCARARPPPPPLLLCCGVQETLRTSAFPSSHVKEKWAKNLYIAGIAYGRTVS